MPKAGVIERRITAGKLEVRKASDGKVGLRGYAAVFDAEAYGEVIKPSAFTRTLAQNDNVRLLVNHDGVPIASTRAGTLSLEVDERGLLIDAPDLDMSNPTVQELVSAMSRGDIDQMSFAGVFTDARKNEETGVREVREVALWDVSVVTFPWYDSTEVALKAAQRSRKELSSEERRSINLAALRMAPAGKTSWADLAEDVMEALDEMAGEWSYIHDIGDDWVVYCTMSDWDALYLASWSVDDAGAVTVSDPVLVTPTYVPAGDAAAAATDEPDPSVMEASAPRGLSLELARAYAAVGRVPA